MIGAGNPRLGPLRPLISAYLARSRSPDSSRRITSPKPSRGFRAFPIEGYIPERPQAHIWNNYPLKESDIPLVDGDPNTSTADRFKRFGSNQTGRRFSLDLGSRFPVNRIAFLPTSDGR